MRRIASSAAAIAFISACSGAPSAVESSQDEVRGSGQVYTLSNDPAGNAVLVYDRARDGSLTLADEISTGGLGVDSGLGSQGALTLSGDGRWLYAVNAGSDELALLRYRAGRLELADLIPSGGDRPISVTERAGLVYVLNAGDDQSISGFYLGADERLHALAGSTRPLSAATAVGAAEVSFNPAGTLLVVTEKATNNLVTYALAADGTPSAPIVTASSGNTPFGFDFDARGTLIVSDAFGGAAGAGAASSYRFDLAASPRTVTGPVANGAGAPCWVRVTQNNHYAFVANTGSGTISTYDVHADGAIVVSASAVVGAGTRPADLALSTGGTYLYVLAPGTGSIAGFRVATDGTLTAVAGGVSGLPAHPAGLVAR